MPKDMAEILRAAIRATGKTGFDIGVGAGVPPSTVTEFLRGKDIRLATADKLARYLGLELRPRKKR